MPTIRIGYSSDFSINSNGVGIGTTFAVANTKLDVVGALKGDFNVTGVTTLAAYGGFVAQNNMSINQQRLVLQRLVFKLLVFQHQFNTMKPRQDLLILVVFITEMINISIHSLRIWSLMMVRS